MAESCLSCESAPWLNLICPVNLSRSFISSVMYICIMAESHLSRQSLPHGNPSVRSHGLEPWRKYRHMYGATKPLAPLVLAIAIRWPCMQHVQLVLIYSKWPAIHVWTRLKWRGLQPLAVPCPCRTAAHILRPYITAQINLRACGAEKRRGVCLLCHSSAVVVVGSLLLTMNIAAHAAYLRDMAAANHI